MAINDKNEPESSISVTFRVMGMENEDRNRRDPRGNGWDLETMVQRSRSCRNIASAQRSLCRLVGNQDHIINLDICILQRSGPDAQTPVRSSFRLQ